jgi:hypothetical protein
MADTQTINAGPVTVKISGLEEARYLMRDFPARLERKVLRGALNKAAVPGIAAARYEARKHSEARSRPYPHLDETIGKRGRTKTSAGTITVSVMEVEGIAHGWFVEHGHRMVVGGTVMRLNGRAAGIEAKSRYYCWVQYLGTQSRYRKLRKAGTMQRKAFGQRGHGTITGQVPPHPWISIAFDRSSAEMTAIFERQTLAGAAREFLKGNPAPAGAAP